MKAFGINGSSTDHGGSVIATQQRSSEQGIAFLRAGDGFACPKCKCWSTLIKSNDHVIFDGIAVAFAGDKFTCGATLLPKQNLVVGTAAGSTSGKSGNTQSNLVANGIKNLYSGQYQLINETDGSLYKNVKYSIEYVDGRITEGVTDENGMTEKLEGTEKPEDITITLSEIDPW